MADENIRRDENLLCGRLVAMPTTSTLEQLNALQDSESKFLSIDFPAMPDTIELARTADYKVSYSLPVPDGVHTYVGTKPLEIPISFKLHSFDKQYCKKGALTLLQLAARLHSFVLPISVFSSSNRAVPNAPGTRITSGKTFDAAVEAAANQNTVAMVGGVGGSKVGGLAAPVTCWLHLVWAGNDKPGISARGYVREVSVKLNGPYLRGPNNSFNLPTSADFSFVFIHRPGHGNDPNIIDSQFPPTLAQSGQAYAQDVKNKFFNTRELVWAANYQGIDEAPSE